MKKFRLAGHIKNGKPIYFKMSTDGEKRYSIFLQKNEGKRIETTIEIDDGIDYWIHKYYRGSLLPDIANAMGEISNRLVHKYLKWEFNGIKCTDLEEIPLYVTRDQLILQNGNLLGYVKSMAKFKLDEAKEFLKFCEYRLFNDLKSHIGVSAANLDEHQKNAHELRKKIF